MAIAQIIPRPSSVNQLHLLNSAFILLKVLCICNKINECVSEMQTPSLIISLYD